MSDSKYYTPSIEEFHVGFEFEAYHHNDWYFGEGGDKWVKLKWDAFLDWGHFGVANIEGAIQKEWLRVKYLDREDVESLGWNKSLNNDKTCYKDIIFGGGKKIAWILVEPSNHHCLIYTSGVNQPCTEGDTIFTGTIKNKSKLKQILQCTGILK